MRSILILFFLVVFSASGLYAQNTNQFSFAFLTDIHLQPERDAIDGFKKAIDTLNKLNPDFVITGGDLIMDALYVKHERADSLFHLYKDLSATINAPLYNAPGNHEYFALKPKEGVDSTHADYAEKMYQRHLGETYYSFDKNGWHFIILDAMQYDLSMEGKRKYKGKIDNVQLQWLKDDLANIDKSTPIAITSHFPFVNSTIQLVNGPLKEIGHGAFVENALEVLQLFKDYNLKLVLQGHLHNLEDINMNNQIRFITGGAVSARWWKGDNNGMQEGFLMLHINGEEISWDYIDYGWEVK